MKFSYSDDGEMYGGEYATLELALADALDCSAERKTIHVGECVNKSIGGYFNIHDVENILEQLRETAADLCGECAEDWLDAAYYPYIKGNEDACIKAKAERAEELAPLVDDIRAALEKWATANGEQPSFWQIINAKEYTREEAEKIIAEPHH